MAEATTAAPEGRRERNKRLKAEAILAAATELFSRHGYEAVTTQAIAERADVSNGTLFRYARTKADLLVTVMGRQLELGRQRGLRLAAEGADPVEAVVALLAPLAETSLANPEVVVAYQRELLFGARPDRGEALDVVEDLEDAIAAILRDRRGAGHPPEAVAFAAYAVYSTIYMDLVRVGVGRASAGDLPDRLRTTVRALVDGLLPAR